MDSRTRLLLGDEAMERIAQTRVIVFGTGGVGSWCAECLLRSGIRRITLVDCDKVAPSNCNRQLMATSKTIGMVKVEALRQRLLDIAPEAEIHALEKFFCKENAHEFGLEGYDYIIDAIDSLQDKAELILRATSLPASVTFISSMGAALRIDPFKVREAEFWNVKGDALARALRNRFKKDKTFPSRKFRCVYSEEQPMPNKGQTAETSDTLVGSKVHVNGSICQVTAVFGMCIASMVIKDLAL